MSAEGRTLQALYAAYPLAADRQVRLLKISHVSGRLSFNLSIHSLDSAPNYRALSYTWGPSRPEDIGRVTGDRIRPTYCDGYEVLVTENLYCCLLRLSDMPSFATDYFWVDLVSVNQENISERMTQVKLMASIYHSAQSVLVWLGEEDDSSAMAFRLIASLGEYCDQCLHQITPRDVATVDLKRMLDSNGDIESWMALQKLFRRTYFSRVWIIQEIMLARSITTVCGKSLVDWAHLAKVSKMLTVTQWTRWMCPTGVLPQNGQHQSYHSIPNLLRANNETRADGHSDVLLYSLIRARRFASTDPRDKVYALLGIAGDAVKGKSRYDPIYGQRTVHEAYIQTSIQMLLDSDHLLLLSCAEGRDFHPFPLLPSWAPDWSCNRVLGLGITGYQRFCAAAHIPRALKIDETDPKHPTLTVSGFQLDHIVGIGTSKHEILTGASLEDWISLFCKMPETYFTSQSRSEVFWRSLCSNTAGTGRNYPAAPPYGLAFASWIESKILARDSKMIDYKKFSTFCQSYGILALHHPYNDSTAMSTSAIDAEEYETTFSHSPHLRPFITSQEYFGVGSESLRSEDSVWIVAGSRVPLVLRSQGINIYSIVGGAYVHGLMNGEVLDMGHSLQDITIV